MEEYLKIWRTPFLPSGMQRIRGEWYLKAAALGQWASMNNLGCFYEEGLGVEKNLETAFEWYLNAAEGGEIDAMEKVADMYEIGTGTEKDLEKAEEWRAKAAE